MAEMTIEIRERVESWMAEGRVEEIFARLAKVEDLHHADQPPVSKQALRAIEQRPDAVRALVLGLTSTNTSVRGFARKHVRRLSAPVIAGPLLRLAVECIEPLHPGNDGLLGEFGGFRSPLGQVIEAEGLSQEVSATEARVYAPASLYIKEVVEAVVPILGGASLRHLAAVLEYSEALIRRVIDQEPEPGLIEPHGLHHVNQACTEPLFRATEKHAAEVEELFHGWVCRVLVLDRPDDPDLAALAERLATRSADDRQVGRRRMAWHAMDWLRWLGSDARRKLYSGFRSTLAGLPDADRRDWDVVCLQRFRKYHPDEIDDPETLEAARQEEARRMAEFVRDGGLQRLGLDDEDGMAYGDFTDREITEEDLLDFAEDDGPGLGFTQAREEILWLSDLLGLPEVFAAAKKTSRSPAYISYTGCPEGGYAGTPLDAAVLWEVLRFFVERKKEGQRNTGDAVLARAPWTRRLDALLRRAAAPWLEKIAATTRRRIDAMSPDRFQRFEQLVLDPAQRCLVAAFRLLPERMVESWGDLWQESAGHAELGLIEPHCATVPDHYRRTTGAYARFVGAVLGPACQYDEEWCALAWELYRRDDPEGNEAVRRAIASTPLPPDPAGCYSRRRAHETYSAILHLAWQRGDLALLASAMQRCALPCAGAGARACLPKVTAPKRSRGCAPAVPKGTGIPLTELWTKLRAEMPDAADRVLEVLLPLAGTEALPVALLRVVDRVDDDDTLGRHRKLLVSTCKTGAPRAIAAAFDLLRHHPGILEEPVHRVLATVHCLSARPATAAVVKAAVGLTGELCRTVPSARRRGLKLLFGFLRLNEVPLLEKVLRELKRTLAPSRKRRSPRPPSMDDAVVRRLQVLARREPERLGRYAAPLLEL